jgi:hypothetical protein
VPALTPLIFEVSELELSDKLERVKQVQEKDFERATMNSSRP